MAWSICRLDPSALYMTGGSWLRLKKVKDSDSVPSRLSLKSLIIFHLLIKKQDKFSWITELKKLIKATLLNRWLFACQ